MKIFKLVAIIVLVIALACAAGFSVFYFEPYWKSNKVKVPTPVLITDKLGTVEGTDIGVYKVCLNGFWYIVLGNQKQWKLLRLPTPDNKLVECSK